MFGSGNSSNTQQQIKRDSKYTATQFLSFSINTAGGVEEFGECEGRFVDTEGVNEGTCYLGNQTDLRADLEHRFLILKTVLEGLSKDKSTELPKIDHSSNVLKIFMLPEFFWRGPHGAYSLSDLDEGGLLIGLADYLYDVVKDPVYEDWLFVFGTVIMAQNTQNSDKPWQAEDQYVDEGEILYFNFAPVVKGGSEFASTKFSIFKTYISTADFLGREQGLPDPRESNITQYQDLFDGGNEKLQDFILNERGVHVVDGNVFEVDGIRFGMEICLDHAKSVLWDNMQEDNADLVDVHLIVSEGMSIERGPTPLQPK
ncbi:MAG: hypothetical protein SGARI_008086, partial [Bacillariaceae sp.]